jgi:hypothetical protein
MRTAFALIAATLGCVSFAQAECAARSGPNRAHLVELYTSEGCSSCPPAEHWLGSLPADASAVALEFHVDYWDSLGWRDRFADPRFSARQQALAGNGIVYTPEIALDGRELRDWYRAASIPAATNAPFALDLRVDVGDSLKLSLALDHASGIDSSAFRAYFAITEDGLSSAVQAGENRGTTLRHDHVVRALAGPFALDAAQTELQPPADVVRDRTTVVAFVQDVRDGRIAQAVRLPLAMCIK